MEKIQIELSKEELEILQNLRVNDENYEKTLKRIVRAYSTMIDSAIWSKNIDAIFDEFEETFQKLAE